jgi:hypothetical protein
MSALHREMISERLAVMNSCNTRLPSTTVHLTRVEPDVRLDVGEPCRGLANRPTPICALFGLVSYPADV